MRLWVVRGRRVVGWGRRRAGRSGWPSGEEARALALGGEHVPVAFPIPGFEYNKFALVQISQMLVDHRAADIEALGQVALGEFGLAGQGVQNGQNPGPFARSVVLFAQRENGKIVHGATDDSFPNIPYQSHTGSTSPYRFSFLWEQTASSPVVRAALPYAFVRLPNTYRPDRSDP